jgi:hypothetical protein
MLMTRKEKLEKNPDPDKYVWRKRGANWILVDKQVVRWQERRKRLARVKAQAEPQSVEARFRAAKLFS